MERLIANLNVHHHNLSTLNEELKGRIFMSATATEDEIADLRTQTKLSPHDANLHSSLANLLDECGYTEEAEASFRTALALDPTNAFFHNCLGLLLYEQGHDRYSEAELCYRTALSLDAGCSDVLLNLADVLADLGVVDEAEESYRKAIAIKGCDARDAAIASINLGILLQSLERIPEAEVAFRSATHLDPLNACAFFTLACLLDSADTNNGNANDSAAEENYTKAITLDSSHAAASGNLALLLTRQGRSDEAIAAYHNSIVVDSTQASTHYNLANLYEDVGRLVEAEESYRKALVADPTDAAIYTNLGYLLWNVGSAVPGQPGKAIHKRMIYNISGENVSLYDLHGFLQGPRSKEAVRCYDRAHRMGNGDANDEHGHGHGRGGGMECARRSKCYTEQGLLTNEDIALITQISADVHGESDSRVGTGTETGAGKEAASSYLDSKQNEECRHKRCTFLHLPLEKGNAGSSPIRKYAPGIVDKIMSFVLRAWVQREWSGKQGDADGEGESDGPSEGESESDAPLPIAKPGLEGLSIR